MKKPVGGETVPGACCGSSSAHDCNEQREESVRGVSQTEAVGSEATLIINVRRKYEIIIIPGGQQLGFISCKNGKTRRESEVARNRRRVRKSLF